MKHVGKMKNNDAPVVIVFRTLPGDPNSCLVVGTQGLGPSHHDDLMKIVESDEAQEAFELGTVLSVRRFSDNNTVLPWLHQNSKLRKLPTDTVMVTPDLSNSISLDELNKLIAEQRGTTIDKLAIGTESQKTEVTEVASITDPQAGKTTSGSVNETVTEQPVTVTAPLDSTPEAQAKFYRSQADKLSKQAAEMRRKAEELVPTKKAKTAKEAA
jgi:hypothetical protein